MKKFIGYLLATVFLLFTVLLLLPFLFKDKIRAKVDSEIAKRIDAEVYFGDFGLTLIRNFPNLTIQLDDFGVVGKGIFKGDTLAAVNRFNVVLDIMSVINGDRIEVKKLLLDQPRLKVKILADGKANYDIYKSEGVEPDTAVADTAPSSFALALNEYSITDAALIYDDRQGNLYASFQNLTHTGSGDFMAEEFLLRTKTAIKGLNVKMDGSHYARNLNIDAKVDMDMNMAQSMYRFKDNKVSINDLHLGFDGFVQLAGEDIRMDIKYNTLETEFRNILSLVPGMYTESFKDIKTSGTLALDGTATGTYNEKRLPAFSLNLKVGNAAFKYPDLTEEVKNIQVDLAVANKSGLLEETQVQLRQLHAEFGNNPVDMKALVTGLSNPEIDATVNARLNLEDLTRIFPMEGIALKGVFDLKGNAKGIYNDKSMPLIQADMSLTGGYAKSADFPAALENMSFKASMTSDGSLPNSTLSISQFHTELDKEPIDLKLAVTHFEDPAFDLSLKGKLDLEKLMKIFPIEGTELAGQIQIVLNSKGKQSDVEAGRYMNVPTSGTMQIANLRYKSADLPQGLTISKGDFSFNPGEMRINSYQGKVGSSDITVTGAFKNYLAYALLENEPLTGSMNFSSPKFNVNEWMTEEETTAPSSGTEVSMSPVEIPKGIDFTLNTSISEVLYDNLVLKQVNGVVIVRDQAVQMQDIKFNLLDGNFVMGGQYNAVNLAKPTFDFKMNIAGLNIQEAYKAFNTVQVLAPAAKFVEGRFSTEMRISSLLGMDMMPLMETFTGLGAMMVFEGKVSDMPVVQKMGQASKLTGSGVKEIQLKNTKITFRIENGRIHFDPFDVTAGNTLLNISGSNGFDQSIQYLVKVDAPSGAIGQAANAALSNVTGGQKIIGERLKGEIRLGGTFANPVVLGVKGDGENTATGQAVQDKVGEVKDKATQEAERLKREAEEKARQEAERLKKEAEDRVRKEADRLKNEAEARTKAEADRLKREAEERARKEADRLKKEAEERARKEAEKKAKEEAERKLKEESEKLKNKLKFPK